MLRVITCDRSASTSAVRSPPAPGAVAWLMTWCSAARTRDTTAEVKPSSQLRRQARGLRLQPGTWAASRPCHICSSSEVYSTSVRSMSEAKPKIWIRLPGPGRGSITHWQRSAEARPQSRCAWTRAHGLLTSTFRSAGRSVSGRRAASSARSMPYFAISSAALAVSAWASSGVTPSASALASSLRTRASSAAAASGPLAAPPAGPVVRRSAVPGMAARGLLSHEDPPVRTGIEHVLEPYPAAATVRRYAATGRTLPSGRPSWAAQLHPAAHPRGSGAAA